MTAASSTIFNKDKWIWMKIMARMVVADSYTKMPIAESYVPYHTDPRWTENPSR